MLQSRSVVALAALLIATLVMPAEAQRAPEEGIRSFNTRRHAIVDATVVVRPGEVLENATIVIRDGLIEAVGVGIDPPRDARIWPGEGLTVYAGLIDAAVDVDSGSAELGPGAHWNRRMRGEVMAVDLDQPAAALARSMREIGFTAAALLPNSGIVRGSSAVVSLGNSPAEANVYIARGPMVMAFERGGGYPGSLMGSIALLRQTLADAQWYLEAYSVWEQHPDATEPPLRADTLIGLAPVVARHQQVMFHASDELMFLRAARLLEEFNLQPIMIGSGTEFRQLHDITATNLSVILPVNHPARPTLNDLDGAEDITLRELLTWEQAPTNARRLREAGMTIAFTTSGLRNRTTFFEEVAKAIANGLSEDDALAALTTVPAELLGVDRLMGTVEAGKVANLLVVEGPLFDRRPKIRATWVDGRRFEISSDPAPGYSGGGRLVMEIQGRGPITRDMTIDVNRPAVTMEDAEGASVRANRVSFDAGRLSFLIDGRTVGVDGFVQFAGAHVAGEFVGSGALADRTPFSFIIEPREAEVPDAGDDAATPDAAPDTTPDTNPGRTQRLALEGTFNGTMTSEVFPAEGMDFTLTFEANSDGELRGTMGNEFFAAEATQITFDESSGDVRGTLHVEGQGSSSFTGRLQGNALSATIDASGMTIMLSATRTGEATTARAPAPRRQDAANAQAPAATAAAPETLIFPLGAFGLPAPPQQENVLVRGATIWTAGPAGIIENGDMLIEDGRITYVGPRRTGPVASGIRVIDASGKHITPGLIDAHSHTGISGGVNEGTFAITAEVRISDVIDPDDINWYRQLAGGLTAANQLHGSANPMGGQNSVVKLKWSRGADAFWMHDAKPGIKFALGENVTRRTNRYPNSRMGVETLMRDAFNAALEYQHKWDTYNALSTDERARTVPPQRDFQLQTLGEILRGERLVHCHSYRQDEILMLIRVAEEFGFTIGTLQHILEGYKVAEAIAAHGAGASSFSDWWAFKVEVMDAIPFNGAIMHDLGILVTFNSDSNEVARRMNTEAAKAVRYGGVEPHEALKFVTYNAAKQLEIHDRTGSLEVGKDADFVIWSGDPLSTYTRAEQTWIEGARYFDLDTDARLRAHATAERERLLRKIHEETNPQQRGSGGATRAAAEEEAQASNGMSEAEYFESLEGHDVVRGACVSNIFLEAMREAARREFEAQWLQSVHADDFSCTGF